jgi:hypothetical protein
MRLQCYSFKLHLVLGRISKSKNRRLDPVNLGFMKRSIDHFKLQWKIYCRIEFLWFLQFGDICAELCARYLS